MDRNRITIDRVRTDLALSSGGEVREIEMQTLGDVPDWY
jgi:hypothetical protein